MFKSFVVLILPGGGTGSPPLEGVGRGAKKLKKKKIDKEKNKAFLRFFRRKIAKNVVFWQFLFANFRKLLEKVTF